MAIKHVSPSVMIFDNPSEYSLQIDRSDGNTLCFVGERAGETWDVTQLVVDLSAPWPEDDEPYQGTEPHVVTEPVPDLTIARVILPVSELAAAHATKNYSKIMEVVPMSLDEQNLLSGHIDTLMSL